MLYCDRLLTCQARHKFKGRLGARDCFKVSVFPGLDASGHENSSKPRVSCPVHIVESIRPSRYATSFHLLRAVRFGLKAIPGCGTRVVKSMPAAGTLGSAIC
jgi:hypothetical protein